MESAHVWNCVGRCSQLHSDDDYEECVVAMHISPIKGTAQVTFKVVDGTKTDPVNADAGSQWPQIGIWRRGYDAEHGSRRSRAVDE